MATTRAAATITGLTGVRTGAYGECEDRALNLASPALAKLPCFGIQSMLGMEQSGGALDDMRKATAVGALRCRSGEAINETVMVA